MPLPFLFRSHEELFSELAKYRREGEAWFRVLEAARRQLGLAEPMAATRTRSSRPVLPDFVPNTVPSFSGDPTAPPLLRPDDAHISLVPCADGDASAPPLIRGYQHQVYALIPRQSTEDFGPWRGDVLFLSNVGYIPLPPRNVMPVRRKNGHFGAHEISRYAQWQEYGKTYLAFIPTCHDGEVHKLAHNNLARDMAWYEVDLQRHCVDVDDGRYLVSRELHASLSRDWNAAQMDYVRWTRLRGVEPGMPQDAFLRGKQSLGYLSHALRERQLLETIAGYQRYLQEIRGWNNYQQCCSELRDLQRLYGSQGRLLPPSLGATGDRKPYRGIFTWSEDVAKRVGQFGVPVFLIAALRKDQAIDPNWRQVPFLTPDYERAVWEDARIPEFLAGVQETRPLPIDDDRGLNEAEQQNEDEDSEGAIVYDEPAPEHIAECSTSHQELSAVEHEGASPAGEQDRNRRKRKGQGQGGTASKKAKRQNGTADPRPAANPRDEDAKASGAAANAAIPKPRHPFKDTFAWPAWFPHPWELAKDAVEQVDRSEARFNSLYNSEADNWPMSAKLLHGRELIAPQISLFARVTTAGNLSRFLASYAALRSRYFHKAATESPETMHRFSSAQWREIHKGFVHRSAHIEFGTALGLYDVAHEETVATSTADAVWQPPSDGGGDDASGAQVPVRPPTPEFVPAADRSPVISFAPAGKAKAAAQEARDFDARCFVHPLPVGVRALATEPVRYLHEPEGWRHLDAEVIRPLQDFAVFLEEDSLFSNYRLDPDSEEYEAGRYFLMRFVHKQSDYAWLKHHDLWWNYARGWILGFRRLNSTHLWENKPLGYLPGERLTKPLKFFVQQQEHGPKEYLYGTLEKSMCLRVWQSRPFHERLPIDRDPLGKVGCLTASQAKFVLGEEAYKRVHGIAARAVARAEDPSRAPNTTATPQATSSTPAAQITPRTAFSSSTATVFKGKKPGRGAGRGDSTGWDLVTALTPKVPRFEHHLLPAYSPPAKGDSTAKDYEWVSIAWRRYFVWDAAELLFRFEIFALDTFLRESYPGSTALAAGSILERRQMVCDVWQGNGFLPSGPNPLTSRDWQIREPAIRAFAALVRTWPRMSIPEAPETFLEADFVQFERDVWAAYAQTYTDYHWREAPFPCSYPNVLPF